MKKVTYVDVDYETREDNNHVLKSECGKYYHAYIYQMEDGALLCAFFTRKQKLTKDSVRQICQLAGWIENRTKKIK